MKIHPNERSLERVADRVKGRRDRQVLRHVLDCKRCRRRLIVMLHWNGGQGALPWTPSAYGDLLDRLVQESERAGSPLSREQVEAPVLLSELMLHPSRRRRLMVRNSTRFLSWALAELLLERSFEEAFVDPAQAESLVRLGLDVVDQLDQTDHDSRLVADLRSRGLALLGNALRMRSDLAAADLSMREAEAALGHGSGDPLELARLLDLKASLRKDQQRIAEARELLEAAIADYLSVGESRRAGRSLLTLASVEYIAGNSGEALLVLQRALEMIPREETRLHLCLRHNLAEYLSEAGSYPEARRVFLQSQPLYSRFRDPWTQRRRAWVEGKILRGLGQLDEAERLLAWAQRGFAEQEIAYDAALVSLDLAAVHAQRGDFAKLERLSAEMMSIFRSRDIHREALAALGYFRRAVELRTASTELVQRLLTYLRQARHNPQLSFDAGG
ncbi:MAG TPA: tetratricopeptide repeat protein [Thermoanaerobaculia bacterium]|nr:tetratricopeptide repeat protein [Thermoanaerobaculia bacterium]